MFTFVLGTRPEIIKLAPLIRRCADAGTPFRIVHSGQHYDHAMDGIFFEELKLPAPHVNLAAAAPSQGAFFGNMFPALESLWSTEKPGVVIVQGDTNTAFAGAFMAQRLGIPVAHVEAGLRSDDWTMPEEVNRVLIDRIAQRLYVPTARQMERLRTEGIMDDRALLTGNPVMDAVNEHLPLARAAGIPDEAEPYAVITLHRPALVDDPARLSATLAAIDDTLSHYSLRGVFLIHPRTRKNLAGQNFAAISLRDPVGYLPMLKLLSGARLIVTDSGGLQEEAAILHVPCITVRENTERPETVEAGGNRIVGFSEGKLRHAADELLAGQIQWKPLYEVQSPSDVIMKDLSARYL